MLLRDNLPIKLVLESLKGLGSVECMSKVSESIGESTMVTNVELARGFIEKQEKNMFLEEVVEEMKKKLQDVGETTRKMIE